MWFDLNVQLNVDKITDSLSKKFEQKIYLWIKKALEVLLEELKRLTPEDTGNMLRSYKVHNITKVWDKYIWTISNDSDYAIYVEYWVQGRKFEYHKPKWTTFYTWVGNRTFARAMDNKEKEMIAIISSYI